MKILELKKIIREIISEMPYGDTNSSIIDFRVELWDIFNPTKTSTSELRSFIFKKIEKQKQYYIEQYNMIKDDPSFIHRDPDLKNDIVLINIYKNINKIIEA